MSNKEQFSHLENFPVTNEAVTQALGTVEDFVNVGEVYYPKEFSLIEEYNPELIKLYTSFYTLYAEGFLGDTRDNIIIKDYLLGFTFVHMVLRKQAELRDRNLPTVTIDLVEEYLHYQENDSQTEESFEEYYIKKAKWLSLEEPLLGRQIEIIRRAAAHSEFGVYAGAVDMYSIFRMPWKE